MGPSRIQNSRQQDRPSRLSQSPRVGQENGFALARDISVDLFEGSDLLRCEAVVPIRVGGTFRQVARRCKVTLARVVDETISKAILFVTAIINTFSKSLELGVWNWSFGQSANHPRAGNIGVGIVDHRSAHDDAVEIFWEPLYGDESLAPTFGTAAEIRV